MLLLKPHCAVLALTWTLAAQPDPAGHWEGTWREKGREVRVSLDLALNARGVWIASMGVPSRKLTGLYISELVVDGGSVQFLAPELLMSAADLKLGTDGKLTGTISGVRTSVPIQFQRTSAAIVELPPTLPAVSHGLEGDWEGTLRLLGGDLPMVVHFSNRPDKTAAATVDIPDQNSIGVPIRELREAGGRVDFRLKQASFSGRLQQDNRELAGQWGTETQRVPVVLKKK